MFTFIKTYLKVLVEKCRKNAEDFPIAFFCCFHPLKSIVFLKN